MKVSFKAHGKKITFTARSGGKKSHRKSAKKVAAGKRLAKRFGFVSKHGNLYRKSPKRGGGVKLVRV